MNNSNWSCKCGHKKKDHNIEQQDCFGGMINDEDNCPCTSYRQDNLKYLENKLNETNPNIK